MTIHPSQILLIGALLIFILYVFRLRTLFLDRLFFLFFTAFGIVLVINPEMASRIANLLGIGRGADLLLYLFVVVGLFFAVTVTAEIKRIQRQLTNVVRHIAISNPVQGDIDSEALSTEISEKEHPE